MLGLVFNITYTAFSWPAGKLSDRIPRRLLVMALSANIATGELWKHFGAQIPFYLSAG